MKKSYVYNWSEVPVILDVPAVCTILGLTPDTVQKLLRSGQLKGFKIVRSWRINKSDLMTFTGESIDG
jgi:hypothetical protein